MANENIISIVGIINGTCNYILDQMTEKEAEDFEAYFLSNQACLDELELAAKLLEGMQSLRHDNIFSEISQAPIKRYFWQRSIPAWSLAAAMALAVVLPMTIPDPQSSGLKSNTVNVFSIEIAGVRSGQSEIVNIQFGQVQTLLSFYIDTEVESFEHESYGFRAVNEQDELVFEAQNLLLNNASTLFVNFADVKLPPGQYTYEILGENKPNKVLLGSGRIQVKK